MKKIDFRKLTIKKIEGTKEELDLDYKGLANYIYNETKDLGELELARELYKDGELELNPERASAIKRYISITFAASVHEALFPALDEIINPNK